MKKIILSVVITCISIAANAQGTYEKGMQNGRAMLDSASSYESALTVSNYFERVAAANTKEWLPLYYAAFASLDAGFMAKEDNKKDDLYQQGLSFIKRAKEIKKNESELFALEGYLQLMYISNKPMVRAQLQTGAAIDLLEEAKKMDPLNPRPYFVQGQNTFYTPKFFGGGAKNAKPLLEKASALYKTFTPSTELMPTWGKERCEGLLSECNSSKDDN
ncbi:MAG: hypothetical protein ABI723_19040 [Bacteroidia bacterium]